jgi:RNA polymerase I-specific transcription initiation factor RRN3
MALPVISHADWESIVPKPAIPNPQQFIPIQQFVQDAILSRHHPTDTTSSSAGIAAYKALLDLLRSGVEEDPSLLIQVLLALIYNTQGIPLKCIVTENDKHKMLLHHIFRMNPFTVETGVHSKQKLNIDTNYSLFASILRTDHLPQVLEDKQSLLTDIYLHLLVMLVSANSTLLSSALDSLWKLLIHTCQAHNFYLDDETWNPVMHPHKEESVLTDSITPTNQHVRLSVLKLHTTMAKIVHLVPKGKAELYSILASTFPYKLAPVQRQVVFIQQCLLSITNYLTTSHANFLELWLDKCLEMDVEIRIEDDGLVKISENQEESNKDDMTKTLEEKQLFLDGTREFSEPIQKNVEKVDEMANKVRSYISFLYYDLCGTLGPSTQLMNPFYSQLDSIMWILFQHISTSSYTLSPQSLYIMILPSFDSMILTTHRSKFVQFVFFLLCGLEADIRQSGHAIQSAKTSALSHSSLYRDFAAKLIHVVLDTDRDTTTRQSAVCYLASFISRATYVCPETVCETVSALLQFVEIYMDHFPTELSVRIAWKNSPVANSTTATTVDKTRDMVDMHSLFYTVSQAVFYIMCFRGKECIQYYNQAKVYHEQGTDTKVDDDAVSFADPDTVNVSPERWTTLCSHHLQPLRFCLETVRGEFLLLAHAFQLLDGNLLQRLIMEDRKMATPLERNPMISPKWKKKGASIRTAATLEKSRINGGVGGLGRGSNPLQSFFPFDPYLLCKSHKYIEKYYKYWTGSAAPDVDDDPVDIGVNDALEEGGENVRDEELYDNLDDSEKTGDEYEEEIDSQTDADEYLDNFPNEDSIISKLETTQNGRRPRIESMTSNTDYSDTLSKRPRLESVNSNTDYSELGIAHSREEWVQELKRSRALSISDECW